MNRHVIKGRGEHRGHYLCYARQAPKAKPTEDGFVWLPDQRKAACWKDPRYSGRTWATERARLHNGDFVKLVAPKAIQQRVRDLKAYIATHADGAKEPLPCHWFGGDFHDAGLDYCRGCAEKFVDAKYAADPKRFEDLYGECEDADDRHRAAIDGGFDIDHDSPPYCDTCGVQLSGYLTEHGADQELEALTTECIPGPGDVEGWADLDLAITNLSDDDPRWRKIAKVVDASMALESDHL